MTHPQHLTATANLAFTSLAVKFSFAEPPSIPYGTFRWHIDLSYLERNHRYTASYQYIAICSVFQQAL